MKQTLLLFFTLGAFVFRVSLQSVVDGLTYVPPCLSSLRPMPVSYGLGVLGYSLNSPEKEKLKKSLDVK